MQSIDTYTSYNKLYMKQFRDNLENFIRPTLSSLIRSKQVINFEDLVN